MTEILEKSAKGAKSAKSEKRFSSGIDLIKSMAVFFVVCVHFFLHSGFYYETHNTFGIFLWGGIRNIFFLCVPLFLITTGFLQRKKTVTRRFYLNLIPVLSSYLFIAVISVLFKVFYLGETGDILYWIYSLTNFSADNYAWYVSMFVGLYLLIPFLNAAYNSLSKKNHKLLLIGILFLISGVASLNPYHIFSDKGIYMFSEYWVCLYPFLYYFIGAFIGEYKEEIKSKIKKRYAFLIFLFVIFIETLLIFLKYKTLFPATFYGEYNSVFVVIASVFLFLTFFNFDTENKFIKNILRSISKNTLEIYLFSYIFDTLVYGYAKRLLPSFTQLNNYAVILVLSSFLLSYLCAVIFERMKKMKLGPTYKVKSLFDISVEKLKNDNIRLILFDADCTLIEDRSFYIEDKMMDKILEYEKAGFDIIIASNGKIHRINKVFENHPVKAYPMCLKPLPFKVRKIMKGYKKSEVVLIGDQFFTDILCAVFAGIKSYMVAPYGKERGGFMKFKRMLEKIIVGDYRKWE